MAQKRTFSDKLWHDKEGNFVAAQKPNIFLIVWVLSAAVSILIGQNSFTKILNMIGEVAILIWAVLELGWGVNYFRRTLGFCVLLLFAVARFL